MTDPKNLKIFGPIGADVRNEAFLAALKQTQSSVWREALKGMQQKVREVDAGVFSPFASIKRAKPEEGPHQDRRERREAARKQYVDPGTYETHIKDVFMSVQPEHIKPEGFREVYARMFGTGPTFGHGPSQGYDPRFKASYIFDEVVTPHKMDKILDAEFEVLSDLPRLPAKPEQG